MELTASQSTVETTTIEARLTIDEVHEAIATYVLAHRPDFNFTLNDPGVGFKVRVTGYGSADVTVTRKATR
jgi:hypothetical protein